jgi:hypothetical protein
MFSLETLLSLFGAPSWGDRLESVCYNNLPGTFSADMWAHQYDQLANQVVCSLEKRDMTNGPEALIYGLAPNYKCCTANFSQGWPKFVAHMWMRSQDDGLVAAAYGPSQVSAVLGGVTVSVTETTDYPFAGTIEFEVQASGVTRFPLRLRIPSWAAGAEVTVPGERPVEAEPGTFHRIVRDWKSGDRVILNLPMKPRVTRRFNNAAVIHRGPLVFSLHIDSRWVQIKGERPHADYEVFPTTPWNYALVLDEANPEKSLDVTERTIHMPCFSEFNAPVSIAARARALPSWGMENASAAPPPESPVKVDTPVEEVRLIPYGAAKLRVTEFPVAGE